MSESTHLLLALTEGILLGFVFYGGLLWTVHKGVLSKNTPLWFLGSFLLRTSLTLLGFYFILNKHWSHFLVCFLGFIGVRHLLTRLMKPTVTSTCLVSESDHAS